LAWQCPRPTQKAFPLPRQGHILEALQTVCQATPRILTVPGGQGHLGEGAGGRWSRWSPGLRGLTTLKNELNSVWKPWKKEERMDQGMT
jgi:hypothetical protein